MNKTGTWIEFNVKLKVGVRGSGAVVERQGLRRGGAEAPQGFEPRTHTDSHEAMGWNPRGESKEHTRHAPSAPTAAHSRRFSRATNGFSKTLENHGDAVAHHFTYYNFVHIHQTLRVASAVAAGVMDRLWEMFHPVAIVEAADAVPKRAATYKKQSGAA